MHTINSEVLLQVLNIELLCSNLYCQMQYYKHVTLSS